MLKSDSQVVALLRPKLNNKSSKLCALHLTIEHAIDVVAMSSNTSTQRSQFRPCIDLHGGLVKQIVGGTLGTDDSKLKTNFVAT